LDWLHTVTTTFGTKDAIAEGTREELTSGLLSPHAFYERLRFVDGGLKNLPGFFWAANQNDVAKVRRSLSYLAHGSGEFVTRSMIFCPFRRRNWLTLESSVPLSCLALSGRICARP
jgi:hypothetical protein